MLNDFSGGLPAVPSAFVNISGMEVPLLEWAGKRVMPLATVDYLHKRKPGTARYNFNYQRERFLPDRHVFVVNSNEAKSLGITAPSGLVLLTEYGYLLLATTFQDDLSYQIREMLIECYFRVQSQMAAPAVDFDDTETLQKMLLAHMGEKLALKQRVQIVETRNLALTAAIEVLEPKAEEFERFIAAKTNVTIEVFVKRMASIGYDIGRTRCFAWMRAEEIIEKRSTLPYQEYVDAGYFTIRETVQTLADGSTRIREQTLVTPKGQVWLAKRLQKSYRTSSNKKR